MLIALVYLLRAWLLISPVLFLWWFFAHKHRQHFFKKYELLAPIGFMIAGVGSFFLLMMVLSQGIEQLLKPMLPSDWGHLDDDGEFVSTANTIGWPLGMVFAIVISAMFSFLEHHRPEKIFPAPEDSRD